MKNNEIKLNEKVVKNIVRAIEKAYNEDKPEYLAENWLETNNASKQILGDYINDNLRKFVVSEGITLLQFKRSSWEGRLIVDIKEKITYSILTKRNLMAVIKKTGRKIPHYLQSILHIENGEYVVQELTTFSDYGCPEMGSKFDGDTYRDDYTKICGKYQKELSLCHHYIIAYDTRNNEICDMDLYLLGSNFEIIDQKSLGEYMTLDFSKLTEPHAHKVDTEDKAQDVRNLVKIKKETVDIKTTVDKDKEKVDKTKEK